MRHVPGRRRFSALVGAGITLQLLAGSGWAHGTPGRLRVGVPSVGQGDAALITSPAGKTVLIDGGPREAGRALVDRLRAAEVETLDLVLLSHRHSDHLGGLATVLGQVGARQLMDGPFPHPSPAYAALLRLIDQRRIPLRQAQAGRSIDLGGDVRLLLLGPPEPPIGGTRSDANANCVVA